MPLCRSLSPALATDELSSLATRTDILDKPLESIFGYITVLPGAFSACASVVWLRARPAAAPLDSA